MVAFAPFGIAVAVSSFRTFLYYSVTNLSALQLQKQQKMFPRSLAAAGVVGALGLTFVLLPLDVGIGLSILFAAAIYRCLRVA